ncbi:MAG: NAD-dependent epimerase/dehydratase family protein [Candidatus Omnitrophica bacterium]|nr:NAD-dependent epimerase/dehydratase family protein [Candidatus Omnitrophota bacterium]
MSEIKSLGPFFVTGGAGFIGSVLVDRLVDAGCEVTVYDNLCRGINWVEPHARSGRITFVEADLLDRDRVAQAMAGTKFVWHLGGNTDIPAGLKNTELDIKHAVVATYHVLEAMRRHGIGPIVFTSSGAVYGRATVSPSPETYGPLMPLSLYGAGKLACEGMISAYCEMFHLRARIVRLGNAIGARMGHSCICDFVKKLSKNPREMEILGDGSGAKNYFLVDECVDGMLHLVTRVFSPQDPACDIINVGTSSSASVMTIVRILLEEMGLKDVRFRYTGGAEGWPGDQATVYLDVRKVNALGWSAKLTSEDAIRVAIQQYLNVLAGVH